MAAGAAGPDANAQPHSAVLDEDDLEEDLVDDEISDGDDSGDDDEADEWDVCAVPIFTTEGIRRLFRVERTVRCVGSYRPSFEYTGSVVEVAREGECDISDETALADGRVVQQGLTLSLRYEPPSPKFSQKCPTCASYRLKVSRGNDFLYSTRGMNKQIVISKPALVAVWGNLELGFGSGRELATFLGALKYVQVTDNLGAVARPLLPAPPAGVKAPTAPAETAAAAAAATTAAAVPLPMSARALEAVRRHPALVAAAGAAALAACAALALRLVRTR